MATELTTSLERAQHIALLMGGNGLSQNQQVALIAANLEEWKKADTSPKVAVPLPREQVLTALQDPRFTYRTSHNIAKDTGLDEATVIKTMLSLRPLVFLSRHRTSDGGALWAHQDHLYSKMGFWEKFSVHLRKSIE